MLLRRTIAWEEGYAWGEGGARSRTIESFHAHLRLEKLLRNEALLALVCCHRCE